MRYDRSCHCLSRVARNKGSHRHSGVNRFVRPNECKCRGPSVMGPEAQLSDPVKLDTSEYDKIFWEDIQHACAIISQALDIGRESLP